MFADLFAETEGFLAAKQDQVILTRNYKKYILKKMWKRIGDNPTHNCSM